MIQSTLVRKNEKISLCCSRSSARLPLGRRVVVRGMPVALGKASQIPFHKEPKKNSQCGNTKGPGWRCVRQSCLHKRCEVNARRREFVDAGNLKDVNSVRTFQQMLSVAEVLTDDGRRPSLKMLGTHPRGVPWQSTISLARTGIANPACGHVSTRALPSFSSSYLHTCFS